MPIIKPKLVWANIKHARKTGWKPDYCLNFVHTMFNVPSDGTGTAIDEIVKLTNAGRLRTDAPGPFGVLCWKPVTGHTSPYGHVAIRCFRAKNKGYCWTTDYGGTGTVRKVKIADITAARGGGYVGWSKWVDGAQVRP